MSPGYSPGPHELLMAQSAVREAMERQWHSLYIDSLTSKEEKVKESGAGGCQEAEQGQANKPVICIEHTVSKNMQLS